MKKRFVLLLILTFCVGIIFSQQNAVTIKLGSGIGFADNTSFIAGDFGIGFEFKKNRIELSTQSGSKKRREYANGDFVDAMMDNYTVTYSRLFTKNKFSIVPKFGVGYVSGRWKITESGNWYDPNYQSEGKLLTGFGLNYGIGFEYSPLRFLTLSINYNEALLLSDPSGNRAIFGGVIFKISKRTKKEKTSN